MTLRLLMAMVVVLSSCVKMAGQQTIIPPKERVASSFAIFVDEKTFSACKEAIGDYKQMLEEEGLATYLLIADWESPEHVKFFLEKYYREQALEGAVFIGDIPIVMVRRAQHLTSAFKMDQKRFPMRESSVPSDRFYDDFNLKFDFIGRDSTERNMFYYNLSGNGPQKINCNIYTGRIKPTRRGTEGYIQISDYLRKVVEERKNANCLDKVTSYTGHGSFSNSLAAWKDESVTLREQMPDCFNHADGARFYMFYMYPSMKETIIGELQRNDLDLMLFHEHGVPERQYLTGNPDATYDDEYYEYAKLALRQQLRNAKASGKDIEGRKASLMKRYGIDTSWFTGAFSEEVMALDSLEDLKQGIIVEEIPEIAPNVRMVIFDACYNGDFREESFIAGEYIFASGKCLVGFGNSVNVLQDKSSSDLLGLLSYGFRVGEWARHVNILESHIIGDPTFRFTPSRKYPAIKVNSKDTAYWLAVLEHDLPCDVKGLALYKLFDLNYAGLSDLLLEIYRTSDYYMLRLQTLHLMAYYNDGNYQRLLKLAVNDPYEFIRRKAVYYMGKVGRNDFIPYMVDLYLDDYLSERVAFNVTRAVGLLDSRLFLMRLREKLDGPVSVYDKEKFYEKAEKNISLGAKMNSYVLDELLRREKSPKSRLLSISSVRNNPANCLVTDLLSIVKDETEDIEVRIGVAEALGWYVYSERKGEIMLALGSVLKRERENGMDPSLEDEILKSINRLKVYMR